ncbi:MAG: hypothetical protein HYX29_06605 [Solirubrobacterales bacterium]|nr:hypothetical protein [Solirubrobacterales bacterium]
MPEGLLAPRLYRAAFAPALFALIVLAFSLQQSPRSVEPDLSPPGFSAARAEVFANQAVENYGARESGSSQDTSLGDLVDARLEAVGFSTTSTAFDATTLSGKRSLMNVVGTRPGPSDRRLLVVASRDGSPGKLAKNGALETGILLELARVLESRAFEHTLVMASVSGGVDGGLGTDKLVKNLRGPFDAIIVLRNVGAKKVALPLLTDSDSRQMPDARFTSTLGRITSLEIGGAIDKKSLASQLVRLGFPIALGEQSTLAGQGLNGASVSPGGDPLRPPTGDPTQIVAAVGQTALRALTTFDDSIQPAPPIATPLKVGGKLVPQWALVLLIGALFFPLIVTSIDSWARARRWRHVSRRGLLAPAIATAWLLLLGFLLRGVGLTGLIDAPPLAPDPGAVTGGGSIAVGIFVGILAVLGVLVAAASARQATPKGGEAGFAVWVVFTGLAVFVVNPIAAGFLILLLHLVVLLLLTGGARRRQVIGFGLLGILPLAAAFAYFPAAFGISLAGSLRYLVLLEAGGFIGPLTLAAGCALTAATSTSLIHLFWSAPREPKNRHRRPTSDPFQ